ncbi:transmembrane protease serine 12 [Manduca sexta]|uniref:transmembrane protease serine 12 n=1 Tax=Manduca sexta TaxID=7130 RepID=UPI00188EC89D|nr:transmembrane protease serine 12 [Manduca sexta]XP_037299566.1 transmembrane protease serine 12 [Manduca sexta]
MQICGGTIIAKNVVLTAAHCLTRDRTKPKASLFAVAAGKVYRPWNAPNDVGAQKSNVYAIEIPPRYQGPVGNFQEDIALLFLNKALRYNEFVRPACLNFNPDYDKTQLEKNVGSIVGWGLTGENSLPSQVLQAAELPIVPIEKCLEESPVSFRSSITGDKFCAGHTNGTAVCRGDSGGGLTIPGIVKRANVDPPCFELHVFLRGVTSTSPTSDNSCNVYTWATFTHLLRHEHFVKAHVPDIEESCVPLMVYKENELLPV